MTDTSTADPAAPRRGRRRALVVAAVLLGLVAAAWVGTAWAVSRTTPSSARVAGLDVGDLTGPEVAARVEEAVAARAAGLEVTVAGRTARVAVPQVDADALADRLTAFTLDPRQVLRRARADVDEPAGDAAAVRAALTAARPDLETAAEPAAVRFAAARPVVVPGRNGTELDLDAAVRAVRRSWLATDGPLTLPARQVDPPVSDDEAQRFAAGPATTAVSAPLLVSAGGQEAVVPPERFAPALSVPGGDALALAVDGAALREAALAVAPALEAAPRDASVAVRDGRPVVTPSVEGRRLDPDALAAAAGAALATPGPQPRPVRVEPVTAAPELTTQEVQALGVRERISTFSTATTPDPGRTENLRIAARTIDGTLVRPGETFSLNEVLGERTPEKGYNQAPAISGGRLVLDYGGGVSQVATTVFNAAFFGGLEIVTHKPHSYYISRYPVGREATVNWPTIDLKWRNDSPTGVLVEAGVSGGELTVSFYGTARYEVESRTGPRRNLREPQTVVVDDPGCIAQSPNPGFDITVTRVFSAGGREVRREDFDTRYLPENEVVCR